eukprot:TRINITY_DN26370_c0_g2_i1.p3 TRINITY_DN26370_c0_g2~~TRINITY_DN26370_c0_g2_i1.p3  ORF type:complete len:183 (+),score=43.70 TRINITY_DN26370_c0_g2_i1:131-679(+)
MAAAAAPADAAEQQQRQRAAAEALSDWALGVAEGLRLPRAVGVRAAALCCAARDADPNACSSPEGWAGAAVWFCGKLDNRPRELANVVRVVAALRRRAAALAPRPTWSRRRQGASASPAEGAADLAAEVLYCERRVLRTWCSAPPQRSYDEPAAPAACAAAAPAAAVLATGKRARSLSDEGP